jgi:asparagine synthase (glutamine-hydrolysing)
MCGILGFIDTPWNFNAPIALKSLYNRGPDEKNYWKKDNVVFGHTRLSVIDIHGGHQPMTSKDSRFILVFNGEIYNFKILKKELEKHGHVFTTHSDTEVVLNAFIQWKEKITLHLDGMFAFSVWDVSKQKLFCARDRVGIKPLFYSLEKGFSFSSSLKSFIDIPGFPKGLNFQALRDFLAFQTCLAPDSFLEKVKQLPPASQLTWDLKSNKLTIDQYWRPSNINQNIDRHEIVDEVDRVLGDSVKNQLISDVPLGAFLSGGIDSSLMIHYMSKAGVQPIDTFTLRFGQDEYDETPYAKEVADYFDCRHHILDAPDINGQTWIDSIAQLDQPLADPAYVMTNALSKLTRQHVTVSLSGDGGDELFSGYERFRVTPDKFPKKYFHDGLKILVESNVLPESLLRRSLYEQEMIFYKHVELGPWTKGRKSLYKFFDSRSFDKAKIGKTLHVWRDLANDMNTRDLMNADLWTYLSENCLTKTDRASMAHSLEVRVPMLGNDMLDLATSIPTKFHFDNHGGKRILKELAKRHLPESTWNRKKHGFSIPLQDLFNGAWEEPIDDLVLRCSNIAPFLNSKSIKTLWNGAKNKKESRRLAYTFAVLLQWLDSNSLKI